MAELIESPHNRSTGDAHFFYARCLLIVKRPAHLPDFEQPPLSEVVLGIQYTPPKDSFALYAGKVRDLFADEFPEVREHKALKPYFETFGPGAPKPRAPASSDGSALAGRLWFVAPGQGRVLQVQRDRFVLNWHLTPTQSPYPRFERIFQEYQEALGRLEALFQGLGYGALKVNQCEVSYINMIPVQRYEQAGEWLNFLSVSAFAAEYLNTKVVELVKDRDDRPYARMYCEIQSMTHKINASKAIAMMLSIRGLADTDTVAGAYEFIKDGRERIVTRFAELTTDAAHKAWRRKA